MVGLGSSFSEREKSEQSYSFLGSLLFLPSWPSFHYCRGSHRHAWPAHHLLGHWAGHCSRSVGTCRMVRRCAHQPLGPQRGQRSCFMAFLHSCSWRRELRRAQPCPSTMTNPSPGHHPRTLPIAPALTVSSPPAWTTRRQQIRQWCWQPESSAASRRSAPPPPSP